MSAHPDPLPRNSYADIAHELSAPLPADPDDPPWGATAAFLMWAASMFILISVPLLAVLGYLVWRGLPITQQTFNEAVSNDPRVVLTTIAANLPAHALTFALVWLLATGAGRRPFRPTLGLSWGRHFGFWTSAAAAVVLLIVGLVLAYTFEGGKTPFEEMLESSAAARFTAAFMATATAPIVEELVYRGVLYPAVRRLTGAVAAVVIVSSLFTFVHVGQYYNNYGVIAAVGTLSLALTIVRATTGRLLPCVVIHAVFNGLQCLGLVYQYFYPIAPPGGETQQPMPALVAAHAPAVISALGASLPF